MEPSLQFRILVAQPVELLGAFGEVALATCQRLGNSLDALQRRREFRSCGVSFTA